MMVTEPRAARTPHVSRVTATDTTWTWIVTADDVQSGILGAGSVDRGLRILSARDLGDNDMRFRRGDKVCVTSELALASVLERMDDADQRAVIARLKDKLAWRAMLRALYPDFYAETVALRDLPSRALDPARRYVVKPVKGYFGIGARVIEPGADLAAVARDITREMERNTAIFSDAVLSRDAFMIEEYIEGEEYAVDMFYADSGAPVVTNIYHHPLPAKRDYLHMVYYTSAAIFDELYGPVVDFFTRLNMPLGAHALPIHAEFKYHRGRLVPIELNPLRFGGMGLCELAYHAFGVDPYHAFAQDRAPDWPALWRERGDKVYAFYLGYNGTGMDVARRRPHIGAFYRLFSRVLSDTVLDYRAQPAFAVVYIEEENVARIHDLLRVEFAEYFVRVGAYSAASQRALHRHGMEVRVVAGATLWRQGDRGDDVLLVLEGQLEVTITSAVGGEVVVDVVEPRGVVGELAALDGVAGECAGAHGLRAPAHPRPRLPRAAAAHARPDGRSLLAASRARAAVKRHADRRRRDGFRGGLLR